MRRLAVLALLAGCNGDEGDDDTTSTDDTTPRCETTIAAIEPEDGDTTFFHRDDLTVTLSEPDSGWSLTVLGPGGNPVQAELVEDGDTTKTLDAQLLPSTPYTLRIDYCRGTVETTFTTSALGTPLDPDELDGTVYRLDLSDVSVTEPETVADSLFSLLAEFVLLIKVDHAAGQLTFTGALGDEVSPGLIIQDSCTRTFDFPVETVWTNPTFTFTTDELLFPWEEQVIQLDDVEAGGTFSSDANDIVRVRLAGEIDTRALVPILTEDDDDNAVCALLEAFSVPCVPCTDDPGSVTCVYADIEEIGGSAVETALVTISRQEVLDNPFCEP